VGFEVREEVCGESRAVVCEKVIVWEIGLDLVNK
jgi:hypothetical protein